MAGPPDAPLDPDSRRVVDLGLLAERRARRAEGEPGLLERAERAERLVAELEQRLEGAEELLAAARRERTQLTGLLAHAETGLAAGSAALEERTAALRRDRDAALDRAEHQRAQATRLRLELARRDVVDEAVRRRLAAFAEALGVVRVQADARAADHERTREELTVLTGRLAEERLRREALEALVALERSRAAQAGPGTEREGPAPGGADGHGPTVRGVPAAGAPAPSAPSGLEAQVHAALGTLREALAEARREERARGAREADVERLVTGLATTAERLRAGLEAAEAGAQADLRRRVAAVTQELENRLAAEQAARRAAESELAGRAAVEQSAHRAAEAELAGRLGPPEDDDPPAADPAPRPAARSGATALPAADHPALAHGAGAPAGRPAAPVAVAADLTRAMERLRGPEPPAPAAVRLTPPAQGPAPPRAWIAPALATLDALDAAASERLLVALLAVQGPRARRPLRYALELPRSGRLLVALGPGGASSAGADVPGSTPAFVLRGPVRALAPLVAGGAPRRLRGVAVQGRRRRVRRLLRALRAPVALAELRALRPLPGDLLALLCAGVPAEAVLGAELSVAWVVEGVGGPSRTLVRATPDGRLAVSAEPSDGARADGTVTLGHDALLDALAGEAEVARLDGDAAAVATLQGWLLDVPRRSVPRR